MSVPRYEQTYDVETPELVVVSYSLAGIGARVLAALTDLVIMLAAGAMLVMAGIALRGSGLATDFEASWALAALLLLQFTVAWGYYVLFEGLMDGQTPGKRIHRLRVVRDGGYSVTLGSSAARNLLRAIDMQPGGLYFVGLMTLILNRQGRRLGDLVAGTVVVREEPIAVPRRVAARRGAATRVPEAVALETQLGEDEYAVLGRFVERWGTLEATRRTELASRLAGRFARALPDDGRSAGAMLLELHEQERAARASGVASRGDTGAGRERQALVAAAEPRWNAFASRLTAAQKNGLSSLGEAGVRDFVVEYRQLSADLARLRTASSGRNVDELFRLGRLVAGAHNLLYRDRGTSVRNGVRFLFQDVPREVRHSWAPIALAALLLFGPATVAGVAVTRDATLAERIVPRAMIERAEDGVERARTGDGYIDDPQLLRPVMASSIIANNVQVTFIAFAGGITAGVLTVLLLVVNGISLGSVAGLYVSKGIGSLLLAFVAPHGVLELFAICVAGGAAFLLAGALLLPGVRTRRRALVEESRRSVRLIAGSTVLLMCAGVLEGLVSPIPWWPLEAKLAVSASTLVLLIAYLRGGIRANRGP